MKHSFGLTDDDWLRLAHWPETTWTDPASGQVFRRRANLHAYLRALLEELLRHQPRLLVEASLSAIEDVIPYYECSVRLHSRDRRITVTAAGSTPELARLNAEFFAIRKAVFNREIPILGRLLNEGRFQVDLGFYKNRPVTAYGDEFQLILQEDQQALTWALDGPTLSQPRHEMRVTLLPASETHRARYMVVEKLPDELKELVSSYMYTGGPILLHRFLLALQKRPINYMQTWNEARGALGLELYEEELLHGHHLNGIGSDNRQENLDPLLPTLHAQTHGTWAVDYRDLSKGIVLRREAQAHHPVHLRPRVIAISTYYDQATNIAMVSNLLNVVIDSGRPLPEEPSSCESPPSAQAGLEPVTLRELQRVSGRSDAKNTMLRVLRRMNQLGGQGLFSEIKKSRSFQTMSQGALRNAIKKLEAAGIIEGVSASKSGATGRGAPLHYRLVRPIANDLAREIRYRDRRKAKES